ncbi:MAG: deoxyribodipyrimidine photo-lyase [Trueperaceae bacterium]
MARLTLPRPLPRAGAPEPERVVDRNGRPARAPDRGAGGEPDVDGSVRADAGAAADASADAQAGRYVLYLMERAQRAHGNAALEEAAARANALRLPLLVAWASNPGAAEWTPRRAEFALEGMRETRDDLARRGVPLLAIALAPEDAAFVLGRGAATIVVDRGYLREDRRWRGAAAAAASQAFIEVEGDTVVPVEVASPSAEAGARTLRGKLERQVERFLNPVAEVTLARRWDDRAMRSEVPAGIAWADLDDARSAERMVAHGTVAHGTVAHGTVAAGMVARGASEPTETPFLPGAVPTYFTGGQREARRRLQRFVEHELPGYGEVRGRPAADRVSRLSPYLRFGQISPVEVALAVLAAVQDAPRLEDDARTFLEELIVRRELALNHVWYREDYDRYETLPAWARATLAEHASDPRSPAYDEATLETGATHDPYWNAAMREMRVTGYLHNHMRMYWGKQILAWSPDPKQAFARARDLNDRYFLDGHAPNGYAGVAWSFGLHDRPWPERPVFGKVRSMTVGGLERKADPRAYVARVAALGVGQDERDILPR